MQFIAHPQQKILGLFRAARYRVALTMPVERQRIEILGFELGARDPAGRLNIAKAALAFFDVGLEQIDRAAELFMAGAILLSFSRTNRLTPFLTRRDSTRFSKSW